MKKQALAYLAILFFAQTIIAQVEDVRLYTFLHSLLDHRPPATPTPSDETTILHWIYDIAQNSGKSFSTTGQFGQLLDHNNNLPPSSNLGYDIVPNSWDDSQTSFANSNLNTIIITAANFVQYTAPTNPYPGDSQGRTAIELTENIFNWANNEIPNMRYYIYGNWPEMDLMNAYPPTLPTQSEINEFHDQTIGDIGGFANWWIDYQDGILQSRPELNTRLIPVGMIISKILRDVIPNQVPFDELYEDSAPHGRANIYFLAGMVTYMALYEENIPQGYMPSTIIHSAIRNNLETIRNFIWNELNNFNFPDGSSRVFYSNTLDLVNTQENNLPIISPNPVESTFRITGIRGNDFEVKIIDITGKVYKVFSQVGSDQDIDISQLPQGIYFISIKTGNNSISNKKLIKI